MILLLPGTVFAGLRNFEAVILIAAALAEAAAEILVVLVVGVGGVAFSTISKSDTLLLICKSRGASVSVNSEDFEFVRPLQSERAYSDEWYTGGRIESERERGILSTEKVESH